LPSADASRNRLCLQRLNDRRLGETSAYRSAHAGQASAEAKKEARSRYQFEATESDDELEDELDSNLDETLDVTRRLKALAMAAGEEINTHNERLNRINDKAEGLDINILRNTARLKNIK
jgi:hypothetical protein